ncbi:NitT/TauT family transport system permease protein [Blastococcus colisei]|uniref:NitT/TauT family transport system permease protein n=1 Tax=Blastococcus colisei TaxID=1564162 RepID=A0A543PIA3_9ACTN|nr:ABC transporter permease [Blastococcus colisei]TQN43813.1 NitT/TauT family transport system permease protein [Blastococcus colisei]
MTTTALPQTDVTNPVLEPPKARRRRFTGRTRDNLLAVATPVLLLALWELLAQTGVIDTRFFPAPSRIFERMLDLMATGQLLDHMLASLQRLFIGFWVGLIPALILGVIMGLSRPVRAAFSPLVSGTYPIPKSALLPLILLIFGLGESSKIVMVAIGVFYPVVMNTMAGVMQVAPIYYDVANNYGASKWQVFRSVAVPGAMPNIMTGIELGAGLGLILIAIAEMVGATSGLGFMIWNAWQLFSVETMYVGLLVIAIIGYLLSVVIGLVARLVMPWRAER